MIELNVPKICPKCNNESSKFYSKATCYICRKFYLKAYQAQNKEKIRKYKKQYREKNKNNIKIKKKKYAEKNKDHIRNYRSLYYKKNKKHLLKGKKKYYKHNRKKILKQRKTYYLKNIQYVKKYHKKYYNANQKSIIARNNKYQKKQYKNNPIFKLRNNISLLIRLALKEQNNSKNSESIKNFLPYTIEELKRHIESQFEKWMSWNNWGSYKKNIWKDDNMATWVWNIDHIIPQSKLPYDSMNHPNFYRCWALDNLRPISAKLNIIKSNKS